MLYLIVILLLPLVILLPFLGLARVFFLAIFLVGSHFLIASGWLGGLALTALFAEPGYFQSWDMPKLWMSQYLWSQSYDEPLWKFLVAPIPLAFIDVWRLYFHFHFTMFRWTLVPFELISWYLVIKYGYWFFTGFSTRRERAEARRPRTEIELRDARIRARHGVGAPTEEEIAEDARLQWEAKFR